MSGSATVPPGGTGAGAGGCWLLRADDVLATVVESPSSRVVAGGATPPLVLRRPALVHTLAGASATDVAWCEPAGPTDATELEVRRIRLLCRGRVVVAFPGPGALVVAPQGAFERWGLRVGDRLAVRGP